MKISTMTLKLAIEFGMETAVKMICEAEFDSIDHSLFSKADGNLYMEKDGYFDKLAAMKKIADSYDVTFNQTHAPFGSYIEGDDEYNKKIKPLLRKAIEATSILGAEYMVVHPFVKSKNQKAANMQFFSELIPYAKEHNVKLALENMFGRDAAKDVLIKNVCSAANELSDYVDTLNSEYAVACIDVGHCGIIGENAPDMIRALGKDRLRCLHIHDNDGVSDLHSTPFTYSIDFKAIMKALNDIEYEGELTLEADNFFKKFPVELYPDILKFMSKTARYLADLY